MKNKTFCDELEKNLIQDFNEFLKEKNIKISTNWTVNEIYINTYLMSIFYNIQEYTETVAEQEEIQDKFYEMLNTYCCKLPF